MRFDPSQPADQVAGLPGVAWTQAGACFNAKGEHVTWHRKVLTEDGEQREIVIVETVPDAEPEPEVVVRPRAPSRSEKSIEDIHQRALKAMFEEPSIVGDAS